MPLKPLSDRPLPTSLKVVAWLFIVSGVLAAVEILFALQENRISINLGVIGLLVGPGLLRLKSGWRTCALVLLWIGMAFMPIVCLFLLTSGGPFRVNVFGLRGETHPYVGLTVACFALALLVWKYRVLTRPDVRRLFGLETDRADPLAEMD